MATRRLKAVLEGEDKTGAAFNGLKANLAQSAKGALGLEANVKRMIGAFAGVVGVTMVMRQVGDAIKFATRSIVDAGVVAADLQKQLSNVKAVSGATAKEMAVLEAQAKKLGATTVFTAREAASAQHEYAKAGFEVNQIYGALPGTLNMAAAGQIGLSEAASITGQILKSFALDAAEATDIADLLAKAANTSNQTISDLGAAFTYAAPAAKGLGVSVTETAAALSLLADRGLKGTLGGTALAKMMTTLIGTLEGGAKGLGHLNDKLFDSSGKFLGLTNALRVMRAAGIKSSEAYSIFGERAGKAGQILMDLGESGLTEKLEQLFNRTGTAAQVASDKLDNAKGDVTLLNSAFEGLQEEVGRQLLPVFRDLVQAVTEFTGRAQDGVSQTTVFRDAFAQLAVAMLDVAIAMAEIAESPAFQASLKAKDVAIGMHTAKFKIWRWEGKKVGEMYGWLKGKMRETPGPTGVPLLLPVDMAAEEEAATGVLRLSAELKRTRQDIINQIGKPLPPPPELPEGPAGVIESEEAPDDTPEKKKSPEAIAAEERYLDKLFQLRAQAEEKWSLEQEKLQLDLIDRVYEREITAAGKKGADTAALYEAWEFAKLNLDTRFEAERQKTRDKAVAADVKAAEDAAKAKKKIFDAENKAVLMGIEWKLEQEQGYYDRLLQMIEEARVHDRASTYESLQQSLLAQEMLELKHLEKKYLAEIANTELIESEKLAIKDKYAADQLAVDEKYQEASVTLTRQEVETKKKLATKYLNAMSGFIQAAFGESKGAQYALTIINTARAVMEASPKIPLMALMAATGAIQLANIAKTKPKKMAARGMIVPGVDVGRDSQEIYAQPGEAVLPKVLTQDLMAHAKGKKPGESKFPEILGREMTETRAINVTIPLQLVDERGVRELLLDNTEALSEAVALADNQGLFEFAEGD